MKGGEGTNQRAFIHNPWTWTKFMGLDLERGEGRAG